MNFSGTIRVNRCGVICLVGGTILLILYAFGGDKNSNTPSNTDNMLMNSFIRSQGFYTLGGKVSLKSLLSASIDVAKRGGKEVVAVRKSVSELEETIKGKTKEGVKDSATEGDFRSHKVMYYSLRKAFPDIKVISEEHTETPEDLGDVEAASKLPGEEVDVYMPGDENLNADDITVWIDPLDATKEYTENLLEYVTTMVGVAVKGKPVLGVVHKPFTDETFWAVVGHGNSPNLKPVEKPVVTHKATRIIVSRSHAGNVANFSKTVLPGEPVEIIKAAGAGFKVLEVIYNNADAYVHVTAIKKWDLCAGYGILAALGGSMTTLNGETIDFSGHTDPLNTKGILAYMKSSPNIEKLKTIQLNDG